MSATDVVCRLVIDLAHLYWAAWHSHDPAAGMPVEAAAHRVAELAAGWPRERVTLALDAPPYQRAARSPAYKAHREHDAAAIDGLRKLYSRLAREGWRLVMVPDHEADDVIASMAAQDRESPLTIVTGDKDLWCLLAHPHVTLLDSRTGEVITPQRCCEKWDIREPGLLPHLLALAGDASDGIAGVPGIGAQRAASLLRWAGEGGLDTILAHDAEQLTADALATAKRAAEKAAKAAKAGADGPEAAALTALAARAKRHATALALVAKVHEHRAAVELARDLVALRCDLELPAHGAGVVSTGGPERHEAHTVGADGASYEDEERAAIAAELSRDDKGANSGDDAPGRAAGIAPAAGTLRAANGAQQMASGAPDAAGLGRDSEARPMPHAAPEMVSGAACAALPHEEPTTMQTKVADAQVTDDIQLPAPLAVRPPEPARLPVLVQEQPNRAALSLIDAMTSVPANLAGALVDAQGKVSRVAKDSTNSFHRYKYAAAEEMIDEARGALTAAGLALMSHWKVDHSAYAEREQSSDRGTKTVVIVGRIVVSYTLIHRSGEAMRWTTSTPIIPESGRPEDKAEMAALTANLGYTLRQLLLIPRGDDDAGMDQRDDRKYAPAPMGARR